MDIGYKNHQIPRFLAYPIENLCGIIKPRVKRRNPETIDDLKSYIFEE